MNQPRMRNGSANRRPSSFANPTSDIPGLPARQAAAKLLAAVVDARTSLDGLTDEEHGHPAYRALEGRDRALVRAILISALRFRGTIQAVISNQLDRPLPGNALTLSHVLHVAIAQILYLDVPDRAAVDLAVEQAKADPRTKRFDGLVNGVLRSIVRRKAQILGKTPIANAPDWFVARLNQAYGEERAKAILAAHLTEAPVDFTVKDDPAGWAEKLGGLALPTGTVRVARPEGAIAALAGYEDGAWWVQDAAAALPALIMGDVEGKRVADLCAAPGGKTAQLIQAGAKVTALDISRSRIKRLRANLERLDLPAEVVEADLSVYEPAEPFDAVLLDAPCSSTGTVRRHPDVLWTKSPEEIEKLAAVQLRLLKAAVRLVKPGGRIVFSNCSLDPVEGEQMVERILLEQPELELEPIAPGEIPVVDTFLTPSGTVRTTPADLPHEDPALAGMDGFFAARLRRRG
ncbi:RsmB/NOP family class I SAM-dependent RNA methyltransferase [Tianweitania sp.]|uniref:RsmB/NOP family class I SAM-dependent RNA methyltransferase n=1 Tax=Tianweitania sp. TaxID=2021634 RepID=UPI003A1021A4